MIQVAITNFFKIFEPAVNDIHVVARRTFAANWSKYDVNFFYDQHLHGSKRPVLGSTPDFQIKLSVDDTGSRRTPT